MFLQTPHRALHRGKSSITEWKFSMLAVEGMPEVVGSPRDMKAESGTVKATVCFRARKNCTHGDSENLTFPTISEGESF